MSGRQSAPTPTTSEPPVVVLEAHLPAGMSTDEARQAALVALRRALARAKAAQTEARR